MPPDEWRLSERGVAACRALARDLAWFRPSALASSPERKAVETAKIICAKIGLPFEARRGLRRSPTAARCWLCTARLWRLSSRCAPLSGWDVWKSLRMPAHVAFATPSFGIVASMGVELTPPSG